jgi:DNA-binding FrmR family transcriptional regulator
MRAPMKVHERAEVAARLSRAAGQIQGVERMVEDGRYCIDILTQLAAVRRALQEVELILLRTHLETCVLDALRSGSSKEQERKLDEILAALGRVQR